MSIDSKTLKLPDSFAKSEESNNNKILSITGFMHTAARSDIALIYESLDITKASGKTLDLYGEIYNQKRNGMNDEQYRTVILLTVAKLMTTCDFNGIIRGLSLVLNCDKSEIKLENSDSAARVKVVNIPLKRFLDAGLTAEQGIELISSLFPICIEIEDGEFSGTFEFDKDGTEYDENKGFGNITQTIGGYFGYLILPNK